MQITIQQVIDKRALAVSYVSVFGKVPVEFRLVPNVNIYVLAEVDMLYVWVFDRGVCVEWSFFRDIPYHIIVFMESAIQQ